MSPWREAWLNLRVELEGQPDAPLRCEAPDEAPEKMALARYILGRRP